MDIGKQEVSSDVSSERNQGRGDGRHTTEVHLKPEKKREMAQKAYIAERQRQKILNSNSRKSSSVWEQQQQHLLTHQNKRKLRGKYRQL